MWFKKIMGFEEKNPEFVRSNVMVEGEFLTSKVNGNTYQHGKLEVPLLEELRDKTSAIASSGTKLSVSECVGNVQELHKKEENEGALFQAASQFNLLEMVGPDVTPEWGIDIYEKDFTQGPACAIACGAGTIFRNYFVNVDGQIGQTAAKQIDCLDEMGKYLNNEELLLWKMSNGYALCTQQGLLRINKILSELSDLDREKLKGKLKTGIHWNTEVTICDKKQLVSQIYCSALPVAYSNINPIYWEGFSRLILEATYEATFRTALLNSEVTGNNKVFLTLVGGGAFGNYQNWILESLAKSLEQFKESALEVIVVSYGGSNSGVQRLIKGF